MSDNSPTTIDVIIPTMQSRSDLSGLVAEIERTAGVPVNVIVTGQPVCAAKNRNIGLDQSTSDPVFMVDDDVEQFPMGWAKRMIDVLVECPHCVMVSPVLITNGRPFMSGGVSANGTGITTAIMRMLPTACVAIRRNDLRCDENYIGSGFEDNDYAKQLCQRWPQAEFLVIRDLRIVHRNEEKNGRGDNWDRNRDYFQTKWRRLR